MNPGLVVKLRPTGPWRSGPDSGARNHVDPVYHSDALYSAVTCAMASLGSLEPWLEATARNPRGAAVRFSSCFPFVEDLGFIVPPKTIWPPTSGAALTSAKVRWKSARFIPLGLVQALLAGRVLEEDHWAVDGPSECLMPVGRPAPFRLTMRSNTAVDRLSGSIERHATAGLEFLPGAGLWAIASFAGEEEYAQWNGPVRAAFRLLADSGFGGERSRGWGHSGDPEFIEGAFPDMILPPPSEIAKAAAPQAEGEPVEQPASEAAPPKPETAHWLLSLFAPGAEDAVDWKRGNYSLLARSGRVESPVRSGELKKSLNMVGEGSVLFAPGGLRGSAPDVAPDGFPHPVFRSGFALSIPIPAQVIS